MRTYESKAIPVGRTADRISVDLASKKVLFEVRKVSRFYTRDERNAWTISFAFAMSLGVVYTVYFKSEFLLIFLLYAIIIGGILTYVSMPPGPLEDRMKRQLREKMRNDAPSLDFPLAVRRKVCRVVLPRSLQVIHFDLHGCRSLLRKAHLIRHAFPKKNVASWVPKWALGWRNNYCQVLYLQFSRIPKRGLVHIKAWN